MKKKIVTILLVGVIACNILACGTSDAPSSESSEQTEETSSTSLNDIYITLEQQKNALDDLWNKYNSQEAKAQTSAERISGLTTGINNTIQSLETEKDCEYKEALTSLAYAYRAISERYTEYIKTNDVSELDDADNMSKKAEEFKNQAKEYYK